MKAKGLFHYCYYGVDLIFKAININYTYFNKVGLKVFNSKLKKIEIQNYSYQHLNISPNQQLYLLPDFLFDEYTLLNKEIRQSPHYQFMNCLLLSKEITNSAYVQRAKKGTIDMRHPINYKEEFYRTLFEKRVNEINNMEIEPVLLTKINNLYYILDGKHKASLFKLLDKTCPCIYLENFDLDEYYAPYWKKITAQYSEKFKKHLSFYNKLKVKKFIHE